MKNVLFYQYVPILDHEAFIEEHKAFCLELGIKGKILISHEGINGNFIGTDAQIDAYMAHMEADKRFTGMQYKITPSDGSDFRRMIVKYREEIIRLRLEKDVDMTHKAPYIEPDELKNALESGEEIIFVDARNDYEYGYGHFEGAINPKITYFSEWPAAVEKLKERNLKDKPIVTYCTGGIRCEKASAYLREQGFTNVRQLHGGILRYGNIVGNSYWKGNCFVFDKRKSIPIDAGKEQ